MSAYIDADLTCDDFTPDERNSYQGGDWAVIAVYFVIVFVIGFYAMWTDRKKKSNVDSYYLGGRSMHWIMVGCSLFGSNIGSEHFIGTGGTGAASGISVGLYEWTAMLNLLALGYFEQSN